MTTYPGLPGPAISDFLSREASRSHYADGTSFQIARVNMIVNTGTYLDAPFHRFADGRDVASLPLERIADLEGVVIDVGAQEGRAIGFATFEGRDLRDKAVLVQTGWDVHWGSAQYFEGHPFLSRQTAELLVEAGPVLVGIDSLNIDDTRDGARPAHTLLLAAEVLVIEHLCNLQMLPASGFRFHCVPAPIRAVGSFPVRAYGIIE